MNPTSNFRHLMGNDSEFSEDEGSLPVPSTSSDHSNPSVDSTSSVDPTSSDDSMPSVHSTSSVDPTSTVDSTSSLDPTSSVHSTSSVDPTSSVHSTSSVDSMPSVHSTSSIDSTSSVDPTSSDDSMPSVHSTSSVDPTSTVDSTSSLDPTSSVHSTSSVDPTSSVHSTSSVDSMPSVDSTSSLDSTSSVHSISAEVSTSRVHPAVELDLPSAASSARVTDLTPTIPCTSSMPPTFSIQMQMAHPMPSIPSTSRGIQRNYDVYRFEATRLSSFRNWPVSSIDSNSLAAAGFYYTGEIDRVRCFECQVEISHWSEGQNPMQTHEMCSPECRFIRNERYHNVPIGADHDNVIRTKRTIRNISRPYGLQHHETYDLNGHRFLRRPRKPTTYELLFSAIKRVETLENLLADIPAEPPIQIANGNPERSNSENDTNEMTLIQKIAALEEENRALKDARLCIVCVDEQATITFLPCGHLVTCHNCSQAFTRCIICRSEIRDLTRTFLA